MKKWLVRIIFGFLFFIPLILQLNPWGLSTWLKGYVRIGTPNEWFGFWGSYIGSILSISFAYINSKFEAKRQQTNLEHQIEQSKINLEHQLEQSKINLEHQLEQSKINDLDNAIKIDEINNLTTILANISDYMANICSFTLLGECPNSVMDQERFNSFVDEFANLSTEYMKNWNKFILRYYTDENTDLLKLNDTIAEISEKIGNSINQYTAKVNSNSDNKTLINILQEISKNLSYLYDASEDLRLYVFDLLSKNKNGIQNKQDNLDSKSKAVF